MVDAEFIDLIVGKVMVLALAVTRIAVAFFILPLFSNELIPGTVRNSIFVAFALVIVVTHTSVNVDANNFVQWISLIAKEAFIGVSIGVFFGVFLWAFEAAGTIVDTHIGSSIATIFDPITGNEVTLFGEMLAKFAIYVFVVADGLLLFVLALLESYQQWPIYSLFPDLPQAAVNLFTAEFMRFFTLTLMIAAPIMVVVFLVDVSMGLINRFAQQLNVLFLSISIKSLVALLVLIALLPVLGTQLIDQMMENSGQVNGYLKAIFGK